MTERAEKGDAVRVHYTGRLDSGEVFDSSEGGEPLEFTLGAGDVIPGFEAGVEGLAVGERRTIEIEPEDAYGEHRDGLVAQFPLAKFPTPPAVGANYIMPLDDGRQLEVVVTEVTDTYATIDGNHPLAGRKLIFDLELVEIKRR